MFFPEEEEKKVSVTTRTVTTQLFRFIYTKMGNQIRSQLLINSSKRKVLLRILLKYSKFLRFVSITHKVLNISKKTLILSNINLYSMSQKVKNSILPVVLQNTSSLIYWDKEDLEKFSWHNISKQLRNMQSK